MRRKGPYSKAEWTLMGAVFFLLVILCGIVAYDDWRRRQAFDDTSNEMVIRTPEESAKVGECYKYQGAGQPVIPVGCDWIEHERKREEERWKRIQDQLPPDGDGGVTIHE